MSLTKSLARWPHLLDQLCARFPRLKLAEVSRLREDREKLELYLARTYDLSKSEAADTLTEWLMFQARPLPRESAA